MRAVTIDSDLATLFTFTPPKPHKPIHEVRTQSTTTPLGAAHSLFRYPLSRSYGPDSTCEREESGTSTVDRYGTQGGPPGRMILAQ